MDERTFARAADEYAVRLYAVAYRLLGNRADAEDAVQRALLKAFEARESYARANEIYTELLAGKKLVAELKEEASRVSRLLRESESRVGR